MNNCNTIFNSIIDDTEKYIYAGKPVFLYTFFSKSLRNANTPKVIHQPLYMCDWMIEFSCCNLTKIHNELTIIGVLKIDLVGPFYTPKIVRVSSSYKDILCNHITIIQTDNTSDGL